jgi:hypothetical protein
MSEAIEGGMASPSFLTFLVKFTFTKAGSGRT